MRKILDAGMVLMILVCVMTVTVVASSQAFSHGTKKTYSDIGTSTNKELYSTASARIADVLYVNATVKSSTQNGGANIKLYVSGKYVTGKTFPFHTTVSDMQYECSTNGSIKAKISSTAGKVSGTGCFYLWK